MWRRCALTSFLALASACSRAPSRDSSPIDGGTRVDVARTAVASPSAIFSAPVAGARVASGEAIVAGIVVADKSITAARVDASGRASWSHPVFNDVKWSQDAELHAYPIAVGALLVWRGPVAGKSAHVAAVVAHDGSVIDGPFEVGSFVCATDDGAAWSESEGKGTRIKLRTWGAGGKRDVEGEALTDDFTLTCGAHRAYVVVEGDEATATKIFTLGDPSITTPTTIAPSALGRDEERDLFAWADGDESGVVRIAQGGGVTAADLRGGSAVALRAEGARVPPEDDVAGIDADPLHVWLVTTHDESDACPEGRGGSSVHALGVPRKDGGKVTAALLAPSACERDVGPFWTNRPGSTVLAAWAERSSRAEKTAAPITGLAFRVLEDGATTSRIPLAADALADAGCDATRCYAIALTREPGGDGMKPEAIRVIAYP